MAKPTLFGTSKHLVSWTSELRVAQCRTSDFDPLLDMTNGRVPFLDQGSPRWAYDAPGQMMGNLHVSCVNTLVLPACTRGSARAQPPRNFSPSAHSLLLLQPAACEATWTVSAPLSQNRSPYRKSLLIL